MQELIGHYRVVRKLGAGGMGEVYLAEDSKLHRPVAIKVLPAHTASDEVSRRRLLQEARAASVLSHPNICVIHEVGEDSEARNTWRWSTSRSCCGASGSRAENGHARK